MGRRRRGIRSLKAAKIWVILFIVAGIYTIRQRLGIPESQDLFSDLNSFGESWLTIAWWVFGIALVLLILKKLGGRDDGDSEYSDDEYDRDAKGPEKLQAKPQQKSKREY